MRGSSLIRAIQAAHFDGGGSEFALQVSFEIPVGTRLATENVQAQRAMFGKGVAGDMRFLEKREPRDASAGELVPLRFIDGMKIHLRDELAE